MKNIIKLTVLFFAIIISQNVFGDTYFPKKVKCPICEHNFEITVMASYTTFGTMKDFQKQGAIGPLYKVMINSCPKCHFSGFNSDLERIFTEETKTEILQILEPYKEAEMNDILESEIAAKIHIYLNSKNEIIANIYLVATYLLKFDTVQIEKRKELQKECITYQQKAIENQEYDKTEIPIIYYLIGELYRRTGEFDKAITYFDIVLDNIEKAKKKAKKKKGEDWLKTVAVEQRKMAIEKDEKNDI